MTRCPACPCPAEVECLSGRFPVFCEWARDGIPSGLLLIVSRSRRGDEQPEPRPAEEFPGPAPDRHPSRGPSVRNMVRTCLYRDTACGCVLPTCHAGRGDWEDGRQSSYTNCLACLGFDG